MQAGGELYGVLECDIAVPDYLKSYFHEMPPIFKNTKVTVADIGDHMARFCNDTSNECSFTGQHL